MTYKSQDSYYKKPSKKATDPAPRISCLSYNSAFAS